ncbi:G-protein coupled receptor 52-like [Lytechinus variegatus]|uniref:G-protein coupled receptor 52-like n=1 Tax=Lytechinus variegatus TaxID=7654 RepID=UPI001BB278EF|nr:G-protein coupled receptor 52-like [Lytechinus variegatus]
MENLTTGYVNISNTTVDIASSSQPMWQVNFHLIAYPISALLAILLNCANLVTVPQVSNCFGENTKLCLMCLAVVDLFTGLICSTSGVLFVLVPIPQSVYYTILILCTAFVWQSMLILTLASVDRYIAVTQPLQYFVLASRKRMIVALTAVVIFPLILSAVSYLQSILRGICPPFATFCISGSITPSHVVYNIIPFTAVVITTFVNVRLVSIARRHALQIAALEAAVNSGNVALPLPTSAGMKGLKTVLAVTCVFYLAWLPSTIINILSPIPRINVPIALSLIVRYAITSNSWWNACVYWIMNKSYRNVLLKMLPFRFGTCIRSCDATAQSPLHNQVHVAYIPPRSER